MRPGWVYTDRGFKPFTEYRPIRRGLRKGQVEVRISKLTREGVRYVTRIVNPDQIKRYPEAE